MAKSQLKARHKTRKESFSYQRVKTTKPFLVQT